MNICERVFNKTNTPNVMKNYVKDVAKCDITFYRCPNCSHGYIENILAEDFYEEFTVALDDKTDEHRENVRNAGFERIINRLLEITGGDNESILEIGSGRGYLLKQALNHFEYGLGIEPSRVEAKVAEDLGCDVLVDFFGRENKIDRKFSSFVSTMVFEHMPNPKEAISYAYDLLKDGGSGVIQVPNAQRTYFRKVYFDIYPQHLHYYTPMSLTKLVTDAGFEVLSCEVTSDENYIEIYVRKTIPAKTFEDKTEKDRNFFKENMKKYSCVGLWGASYAARSCIYLLDTTHIKHFFDVSGSKIGGYINDLDVEIERPELNKINECDLIIIMANEYTGEILNSLGTKYAYKGDVILFDNTCTLQKITLD
jgi:cyclopropane fatty-acyl-phospholipid synthase-like methyltransferase